MPRKVKQKQKQKQKQSIHVTIHNNTSKGSKRKNSGQRKGTSSGGASSFYQQMPPIIIQPAPTPFVHQQPAVTATPQFIQQPTQPFSNPLLTTNSIQQSPLPQSFNRKASTVLSPIRSTNNNIIIDEPFIEQKSFDNMFDVRRNDNFEEIKSPERKPKSKPKNSLAFPDLQSTPRPQMNNIEHFNTAPISREKPFPDNNSPQTFSRSRRRKESYLNTEERSHEKMATRLHNEGVINMNMGGNQVTDDINDASSSFFSANNQSSMEYPFTPLLRSYPPLPDGVATEKRGPGRRKGQKDRSPRKPYKQRTPKTNDES